MIEKINMIFFDLGFTLVNEWDFTDFLDTELLYNINGFGGRINKTNYTALKNNIIRNRLQGEGGNMVDLISQIGRLILPVGYDSLIVKRMINKINEKENFLKLSEGAMIMLEKLKKQKYCLGIITNYNIDVDLILKKLEVYHYFDTIVSTFKTGLRKPSIDIFNKAIDLSDYRYSQCAMIGDRIDNDIYPAKRIGIPITIRFTNSIYRLQEPRNENEIPSYTVSNLSEISNIFH